MDNKRNTMLYSFLAFILPAGILLSAYAFMGMAPFGEKTILISDMNVQYVEFFCGLKSGDLFFSWSNSLGGNYIGLIAYYLSSPLSLLSLLCPNEYMPVFLLFLIAVKIGLCGLTFHIFLIYRFKKCSPLTVLFSLFYGLMSYSVVYGMCLMWLDGVFWLPIVIIGVEKLLKEDRKSRLFLVVSLLIVFISNYYIAYMVGLFSALYLIYRSWEEGYGPKRYLRYLWNLFCSAVIAAAIGAAFFLPVLFSLFLGKIGDYEMQEYIFTFEFSEILTKFLPGGYDGIRGTASPYLYCGILVSFFFAVFLFSKKFDKQKRILAGGFALFLVFCMWFGPLDYAWHVFKFPVWFPYRYAFVFVFFVVQIAYQAADQIPLINRQAVALILIAVCSLELLGNSIVIMKRLDQDYGGYTPFAEYYEHKLDTQSLVSTIQSENEGFYRIGAKNERTANDPIGYSYKGITQFSSAYNRYMLELCEALGYMIYGFSNSYLGATIVTDSLFSVQYVIADQQVMPAAYAPSYLSEAGTTVYENPFALSVGTLVDRTILEDYEVTGSYFIDQNEIFKRVSGIDTDVLKCISEIADDDYEIEWQFSSSGNPYYAFFEGAAAVGREVIIDGVLVGYDYSSDDIKATELYVNDKYIDKLFTGDTNISDLGTYPAGSPVKIQLRDNPGYMDLYELDMEVFEEAVAIMQQNGMTVTAHGKNSLSGTVSAAKDQDLFLSVPYDEGWRIFIDGERVEPYRIFTALMAVPLTEGDHEIHMKYVAPGLIPGLWISGLTLTMLASYYIFTRKKRKV